MPLRPLIRCCDSPPPQWPRPRASPAALDRLARPAGLAALLLALTACVSAPPLAPQSALALPDHWAATAAVPGGGAADTLGAQWWSRFNDPLLTELIVQALQANTSVASAQAALRQARALRGVAAAGLLPAVGGSASAQRGMAGGHSSGSSFQAGLDASWELDLFGARRSALAGSEATAQASAANLGQVQVSIAAELALAYIALRGAQAQQAIASANLASQQETLQITEWRMQAGLVTALDTEQARTAAEQTAAQLPLLATRIRQTGHAIAVLTGQSPAVLNTRLASAGPVPRASDSLALAIPAETLRQRADVQAAEWQVVAASAQVDQAQAARAPSFRLGGSLGLSALSLGALSSGAAVVGSLLAGVSLPVFDGGAGTAQVQAQQAALAQAQAAYRASVLAALKEVEDALVALAGDQQRQQRLQRAADAAALAAQLARQRYDSGLVDFQAVLDTQRAQFSTQDSLASASTDLGSDQVRLYKALGGGWTAATVATHTPTSPS